MQPAHSRRYVAHVRIAVAGKGGAGKSVLVGTLARVLARRGHRVLALDSDVMPGLALSLGAKPPPEPPLNDAAEVEDGKWRLKRGIGPVRAVRRFSTPAPDGVLLLQGGKVGPDGLTPIMPALQAFYRVVHAIRQTPGLRDWTIVGDLSAGPRQTAFDWAPYADAMIALAEPTWKSALTARRIARIARSRRRAPALLVVASKVSGRADVRRVADLVGQPVFGAIPTDESVVAAERAGAAPIDYAPDGPAVDAISAVATRLERLLLPR